MYLSMSYILICLHMRLWATIEAWNVASGGAVGWVSMLLNMSPFAISPLVAACPPCTSPDTITNPSLSSSSDSPSAPTCVQRNTSQEPTGTHC